MQRFIKTFPVTNKNSSPSSPSALTSTRSRSRSPQHESDILDISNVEINDDEHTETPTLVKVNKSGNKRNKVSIVWQYFTRSNDRKFAKCNKCGKEYKTSGNTSNLSDHLKRFHPLPSEEPSSSENTSSSARSRSISPFFRRSQQYGENSDRKKKLDRALIQMIALDIQPFSIVDDAGFRRFISLLDPKYILPSTYTIREKLFQEFYLEIYTKLKLELDSVSYVAITCDSWSSVATESYLTVTCHYISNTYELKSAVLSTKPLPNGQNHTSENIADTLTDIFKEFNIHNKISCIVTDNASNMIKCCDILKTRHLPCFAHTLNLCVQDSLNCVRDVINKCKTIVTYFKSSNVATELFKSEQNLPKPYKLLQEVPTRWNSTYSMIQRILQTNEAVARTLLKLKKAPQPLSAEDISILTDIEKALRIFDEATKKVSGCNYVTISLIIPITFGIHNYLQTCEMATEEGRRFSNELHRAVKTRLFPYETRILCKLGTILDPRFKKEGFRVRENADSAAMLLEQEMNFIMRNRNRDVTHEVEQENDRQDDGNSSSLFLFMGQRKTQKIKSTTADTIINKRQYLERQIADEDTDPLLFWKVAGYEYTSLGECYQKYLCIPATSVESERCFSTTCLIISQRRSMLKPKNVNFLTFLHKNANLH